jgi:hypothetical protein
LSDLSRVRNAVRDVAQDMQRFRRDFERLQREIKAALADGYPEAEVIRTANQAVAGHPELQERMTEFLDGLRARTT